MHKSVVNHSPSGPIKFIPQLEDYDIHPVSGFLPSDPLPLARLPGLYFEVLVWFELHLSDFVFFLILQLAMGVDS